ncbi:sigma-70 family RNA polymerase sigma factor [Hymenobacter sp. ASUV-10]|uniref:Sigma-70 family RNA polymerase sigma factor n=1 Tax=Hymenobacter aranciens TaxID=3063996 RepID=A0ABT9BCQ2_9BACT|nr:sigma-70 family RNA polymerase sigma factor [Hymenobacter sp. ASUV-10]MDO7876049.1 sigma-70 family RNA polymerase sigma factor [Hymenobacter sp. ASUV-10]
MPLFENEDELIVRLQARDAAAMTLFYRQYGKLFYPVILRIVRNVPAAEDVLQDSMVKIWSSFAAFDPEKGYLFTWALRICRNAAIDHLRDRRVRDAQRTQSLDGSGAAQQAAPPAFLPEHVGVRELTQRLRPEYRRLIDLLYFEGLTQVEAAERLQMPLGTVKTHSRQAIKELIKMLN